MLMADERINTTGIRLYIRTALTRLSIECPTRGNPPDSREPPAVGEIGAHRHAKSQRADDRDAEHRRADPRVIAQVDFPEPVSRMATLATMKRMYSPIMRSTTTEATAFSRCWGCSWSSITALTRSPPTMPSGARLNK